jgi:type IV pilus assembly protein PilV
MAIAGMMEMSLGRNMDAHEISLVTNLAADMVERIQFNKRNVTAYGGINTLNSATKPPTTQPMARGDYDQWSARLAASGLPSVQGLVTVAAVGPTNPPLNQNQVAVQVNWSGPIRTHTLVMSTIVAPE